jgi:hypothetical protein
MTESNELPTTSSVSERPILSAPDTLAAGYGYALPGRRLALLAVTSIVLSILGIIAAILPQARPVVVPLCLSLIPLLAVALAAAVPFALMGKENAPAAPLLVGFAVILGGAACDIYATVIHSPDLVREANPILRGLLDNGVSLEQVYLFGGILQVLFVGLTMVLWLGFLKHRHMLVETMPPHGSLLEYFKAGTGGRELSYRQWLCPLAYSELPWVFHFALWTGVAFVGISVYRFYLALEWFGVAPLHPLWIRFVAPSLVLLATCWVYAVWLRGSKARLGQRNDKDSQSITPGH